MVRRSPVSGDFHDKRRHIFGAMSQKTISAAGAQTLDLTRGPITGTMLRFALPMIAGNLLQQCYNIADTLIVGRFPDADALAAVGSSYTLMTFLTSIFSGLCMCCGVKRRGGHSCRTAATAPGQQTLPPHRGHGARTAVLKRRQCGNGICFFLPLVFDRCHAKRF